MRLDDKIKTMSSRLPGNDLVLSFYLDIDGSRYSPIQCIDRARQLVQNARHDLKEMSPNQDAKGSIESDLDRVTKMVGTEIEWGKSRGLVVFANSSARDWEVIQLPVSVSDRVSIEPFPRLRPLLEAIQDYPRYIVAIVDQRDARFFVADAGAIEEKKSLHDGTPRRTHSGSYYGLSDKKHERYVDEQIESHFKHAAARIAELWTDVMPQCIVIGGSVDAITGTRKLLPAEIARHVCAEVSLPMITAIAEVLSETILASHTRCREDANGFASQVLDAALGGGLGALGLEPTLSALHLREVDTLVLDRRFIHPGFLCKDCARIFAHKRECPVCGSSSRLAIPDIGEAAVCSALQQDATVQHVFGSISFLREGIGALLRFRTDKVKNGPETNILAMSA